VQEYVINRPEEAAMVRVLERNAQNAAGTILRLAWQAGLLREEIVTLTWAQVDLPRCLLLLPDREIPLAAPVADFLAALRQSRGSREPFVVLSDRDEKPLTPQSVSRLARRALDAEGQTAVRLIDLRHDFVLRALEERDWQEVSRITGISAVAMNLHFGAYLQEKHLSTRVRRESAVQIDEFSLWKLLQESRTTPEGAALWLTWQMGLQLEEIVALTWAQVDFDAELLRLNGRALPLTGGVLGVLRDLRAAHPEDAYVLTVRRSGRPYDRTHLSRRVRAALVRGGLDNVTLRDLRKDSRLRTGGESEILTFLRRSRSITRAEAAQLLGIAPETAYRRLRQMVERGRLTQVGARYYLKGTVVPPERQEAAVLEYLAREGFAYRQDIARLLKIDPRQCRPILQRMIAAGRITQDRQRYTLNKEKKQA